MRDYLGRYGAMEAGNGDMLSRAMKMEAASLSPSKRRKVDSQSLDSQQSSFLVTSSASMISTSTSPTSFLSNGLVKERSKSTDLYTKDEGFETHSTFFIGALSRETSQLTTTKKTSLVVANSHWKPSVAKMPSTEEIEEFFSAAEKYQQKQFAEKYNYDIVKDVAMEGRYLWVRLKP